MTRTATGMPQLILASASSARLALLRNAGFDPEVIVSGVDEDRVTAGLGSPAPSEVALALAQEKAAAVAGTLAGGLVIGCDSILDLDGEALGKPASPHDAVDCWRRMRGRTGTLLTGHCLVDAGTGGQVAGTAATVVRFGSPSDEEIGAYVASGEPLRVAGAFTIDGLGGLFVDGLDGDWANVVGLSLPLLRRLLGELGVRVTDLWCPPAR